MKFKVQLVIAADDGQEAVEEIALLDKSEVQLEDLGLTLNESKDILRSLQQRIVTCQAETYVEKHRCCAECGKSCRKKGSYPIVFRTLFGSIRLDSPRFYTCRCREHEQVTFSPLVQLLTEHTAPELLYLEAKWASLVSYGMTARMLKDVLPLEGELCTSTVRNHLHKVAERDEAALGEEQVFFAHGCPAEWASLPRPEGTLTVGIDGGFVRSWESKKSHFGVIVGKAVPQDRAAKCFGFVQSYDQKPRRRLYEVLCSQGMQMNQRLVFLSDGADDVRELQFYMNPFSEHYLDWFHITMRITVLKQYAKGLRRVDEDVGEELLETLERLKWYLWHGNVYEALYWADDLEWAVEEVEVAYPKLKKLKRTLREFRVYIEQNGAFIPNYGERSRYGETISTAIAESTVNAVVGKRFCKKQQMQWTRRGAHLLLQTRTRVLNGELAACFQRWYPDFGIEAGTEYRMAA